MLVVGGGVVGVAGGVVSSAGGWLAGGLLGLSGTDGEAGGVGEFGCSGVHDLSPPFQAAIRW